MRMMNVLFATLTAVIVALSALFGCTAEAPPRADPPPQDGDTGDRVYLPDLDFGKTDVYGNGRVVYVANAGELRDAAQHAAPRTTIVLKDGVFENIHVVVPKGTHDLTFTAAHRHRAVLEPLGKDDDAAFVFRRADNEQESIHHLNFVGLVIRGNDGQFIKSEGGATYSVHHLYLYDLELSDLFMGIYSGLHSHDWTVDRCVMHDSRWSHMWYMMGWHHTVQNSTFYSGSHDVLAMRGYYPDGEKHTYIGDPDDTSCHGNVYVEDRKGRRGFLPEDDWTHTIRNNRFLAWDMKNPQRAHWNAHVGLGYGIYDGDAVCGNEKVYLPPQNIEIYGNTFSNEGEADAAHMDALTFDAWAGIETESLASVNGIFVHDNVFVRAKGDEAFLVAGYGDPDLGKIHTANNEVRGP